MKNKIKLKDLTAEQWDTYRSKCKGNCDNCVCCFGNCFYSDKKISWINNKDMYSDKFLNRKIDIDTSSVLTKKEKEYLSKVIKPFREHVDSILRKMEDGEHVIWIMGNGHYYTRIRLFENEKHKYPFRKMQYDYKYSLKNLEL